MLRAALVAACLLGAVQASEPHITGMRLRAVGDQYGHKLKLAYQMADASDHEICINCNIGAGVRLDDTGKVERGATCGGVPNGCHTVKAPTYGSTYTFSLRAAGGKWSEQSSYTLDPTLESSDTVHHLEKDEL